MENKNIIELIKKAKINEEINLEGHEYLKSVKFEDDGDEVADKGKYTWAADPIRRPGTVFPMRNSQYVQYFKSINSAKASFIRLHIDKEFRF